MSLVQTSAVPQLQAPIVLVHGLFGFKRFDVGGLTLANYFPGIVECFRSGGNRVLIPKLHPTGGVAHRAQELKEFLLRESPDEPVHLLAHSLGGLDSRYMISKLDMADRVLSLTTLGTPHRGSPFADWAVGSLERLVRPVLTFLGIPHQAFYDLTTANCRKFNEEVLPSDRVRYFSVAARHDGSIRTPEWLLPYFIVLRAEGANDGVVSVHSAQYGEGQEIWDGDHFSLVNWPHLTAKGSRNIFSDRDPSPRYGGLLRRLVDQGF